MANGWTPERKAAMSVKIKEWQPWAKSTGPKSIEGKAKVAMNGLKGRKRPVVSFKAWLKRNRDNPNNIPLDEFLAEALRRSISLLCRDSILKPIKPTE
ncbi:MAG: hypothetical protein Q8N96_15040 [Methylovulum sp.]|nr:hypothetical protein [Methylovulum sp.]